jgi:hypothetical protein
LLLPERAKRGRFAYAPCRRPILNATASPLYARRRTRAQRIRVLRWTY